MKLEDLRLFLIVAEHGNLHRAASTLGLTQSALSKSLARLEAEAGMQLFERMPRGVMLTGVGQKLLAHAQRIVLANDDMENELNDERHARVGRVRVATLPHLVPSVFSPLLERFLASRPLARFSIDSHLSPRLIAALQGGEVDLVCAAMPDGTPADVSFLPLGALTLQIVARTDHPRRGTFRTLADLVDETWVGPAASLYVRSGLEARFTSQGLPAPRIAVESTSSSIVFSELLRNTDMVGLMPQRLLRQAEGQGLQAIEGEGMRWQYELAVFWRAGSYLSPLCRDFRDALVQWCKEEGI
jgi:DNA-binding transcriptional LysR family regulator